MITPKYDSILKGAISTYGSGAQINMVFEEMSELQKELCKHLRGKTDLDHIADEIADVQIMLRQMELLFDVEFLVSEHIDMKVKRLAHRLDGKTLSNKKYDSDTLSKGKGIILSVFAGCGKTYVSNKYSNVCDLESSKYRWIYSEKSTDLSTEEKKGTKDRVPNPEWPMNYIKALLKATHEYDVVLIAQYEEVRELLQKMHIPYALVFPTISSKDEYIRRYRERGNNTAFVQLISDNYEIWIQNLYISPEPDKFVLETGEYLEDLLVGYGLL